jgi:hypothetical protein
MTAIIRLKSQRKSGLGGAFRLTSQVPRCQYVGEADPTKKLGTDAVQNHIDHFRPVLGWIVVHAERSLAKGSIDAKESPFKRALTLKQYLLQIILESTLLAESRHYGKKD